MKVTLINPATASITKDIMPPLGLAWLAAILEHNEINVEIIDALAERKNAETVASEIKYRQPDVVGITCVTHMRHDAFRIADRIKELHPNIPIVMGGPHVTFTDEDTLQNIDSVDIIVRGEGEATFLELVKTLETSRDLTKIEGISYRTDGRVVHNPPRPFIEDLDSLPFPARHLLPMGKYDFRIPLTKTRATSILSSRGCPIGCIFCSTSTHWGKRIRMRSPSNVVDELEQIVKKFGINGIYFFDDTFTFHKARAMEICDEVIRRKLDITWFCESRVDSVDRELLSKMKKAGCRVIAMGVESGSQRVLEVIEKKTTVEQSIKAINLCKKVGIKSKAFIVYGIPGELPQDVEATFRLIHEASPDISTGKRLEIRPGTELESIAKEKNMLPAGFSWAKEGNSVPYYEEAGLSDEEVAKVREKVVREYHLKPAWILRRLRYWNIKIIFNLREIVSLYKSIAKGA